MSQSRLLSFLLLASCTLTTLACATPTDDGVDAESQDSEVKIKVKPKAGNGALDLLAPGFDATGFVGTFVFDSSALKAGERSEKVPGLYTLQSQSLTFPHGQTMNQQVSYALAAGVIATNKLSGLRIRFAEPVTLGGAFVGFVGAAGTGGFLNQGAAWQSSATGASMLVLAGKITVSPSTDQGIDASVAEGALKDVVLPTARVALNIDAYDPAYPTPPCSPTFVRAGGAGTTVDALVRKPDGSPNASFVIPQGSRAPVIINAYGFQVVQATVAGKTNTFTLNRVEVDDVEVLQAGGGSQLVKGTFNLSRKSDDGSFTTLSCTFPTHSGVDLPSGEYRVISRAQSPSGTVTSTEDITIP